MLPINGILWPTDGSEPAMQALKASVAMAETYKAKLYILEVLGQVPVIPQAGYAAATVNTGFNVASYEQELLKTARDRLEATVAEKVPKDIETEIQVELGAPTDVIVDFAREKCVNMIVMATHGRTGMAHLMMGSVTERTIRNSTVPVLVIPAGRREE